MTNQKQIPCRVCGKLFKPCSYCQSHADVFRWRNFACSRECAAKYMNDTIAYRESLKNKEKNSKITNTNISNIEISTNKNSTTKKKNKKVATENLDNESNQEKNLTE